MIIQNKKYWYQQFKWFSFLVIVGICSSFMFSSSVLAARPKPIVIAEDEAPILERMDREITLDVRDMNIVDVIKFLAIKGEFNVIISPTVQGRATVFLNSVSIRDAMDIVVISNHLAYKIQKNIVQVMNSSEYEALFGKRFSDQTVVKIVRLKYAKPSYVLAALDNVKSNIGKLIIDEDTGSIVMIDTVEGIAAMMTVMKEIEKPIQTYIYTIKYTEVMLLAEQLRLRIDAKAVGSITPDERSNKLIVNVYPDRLKEVKKIIEMLDVPQKQVLVDTRILQITIKPEYDIGVDWKLDFLDSPSAQMRKLSFASFNLGADSLSGKHAQIAVGDVDENHFATTLRLLKQVSDTKILSNPQILVVNKEEAKIHIGDTVPYIISTTSGTGDSAVTSEDVRFVDVGLKLNVIPTISDDGYVTMQLRPEISTVIAQVQSQGGGIPQVNKTLVETTVMVRDGHTIILGGLKKDNKVHSKRGFPVLMDLPWVGPAFSRTSDDVTQTEIVILITPHIITGDNGHEEHIGTIKPFKEYSTQHRE